MSNMSRKKIIIKIVKSCPMTSSARIKIVIYSLKNPVNHRRKMKFVWKIKKNR